MRRIPVTLAAIALLSWASAAHAQCGITGTPVIGSTPANLCGTGGSSYRWEGPNGYAATTRCVALTAPGEYRLFSFDSDVGLWFGPCSVTVTGDSVPPPPPPPPPPPATDTTLNCPRPAWYWVRACRRGSADRAIMNDKQMAILAAAVDSRSQLLSWADPVSGFCSVMRVPSEQDSRARAIRQFASVLANMASNEQRLLSPDGREIRLRDNTTIVLEGARAKSLSAWVKSTDVELIGLANTPPWDRSARKAYQRIRRIGWMVNHGMGIGPVCRPPMPTASDIREDDEPMAMAIAENEGEGGFVMEAATPNPFSQRTRIAYTLAQSDDVELAVLDLSGRRVKELARGPQSAGRHEMEWDGRSEDGRVLPAGAYFVHGRVGGEKIQGRLVLVR